MLTAEQKNKRKGRIGSSDVATILGKSLYGQTAYDVWKRITSIEPIEKQETTSMRRGSILEESVFRLVCDEHELSVVQYPGKTVAGPEVELPDWYVDTVDGICRDNNGHPVLVEIKCTSRPMKLLPDAFRLQSLWHLAAYPEAKHCIVAIFHHIGDISYFTVENDRIEICHILSQVESFWENYVLTLTPPPQPEIVEGNAPTAKIDDLALEYFRLKDEAESLQSQMEVIRNAIINEMQSSRLEKVDGGSYVITKTTQTTVSWQAVAKEIGAPADVIAKHSRVNEQYRFSSRKLI